MRRSTNMKNTNKGFTLIELIMVMIILGIMSAIAIPRYLETIQKSEVSSEDAVINKLCVAVENYAQHKFLTEGRRYWPDNPFDALTTKPQSYTTDGTNCDKDNEVVIYPSPYAGYVPTQGELSSGCWRWRGCSLPHPGGS